jgi:hypothetical protein
MPGGGLLFHMRTACLQALTADLQALTACLQAPTAGLQVLTACLQALPKGRPPVNIHASRGSHRARSLYY